MQDLKAANLLLHRDGCVKLADFGNSATLSSIKKKRNTMVGTAQFISPGMRLPSFF
jgi:serine/threonine protein kinase